MAVKDDHMPERPPLMAPSASIIPHVMLYVVQIIALVLPPSAARKYVFSGLIVGLAIHAHMHPHFTNDPGLAQPFTIGWSYYMATLAKLAFAGPAGPEDEFWRVDRPRAEALGYASIGWRKLRWALALVANQRGIRWSHQVKNVRPAYRGGRARFLVLQAWSLVKCLAVADVLFQLGARLFFTDRDGRTGTISSHDLTLRHADYRWSFAKALVFGATPYFMLSMQYSLLAFVAVLLGISKPEVLPVR